MNIFKFILGFVQKINIVLCLISPVQRNSSNTITVHIHHLLYLYEHYQCYIMVKKIVYRLSECVSLVCTVLHSLFKYIL